MWFEVFVWLRGPVSFICLCGYSVALGVQMTPFGGFLGGALKWSACILPVVVWLAVIRGWKSASWIAWWSLELETGGVVLLGYASAVLRSQAFGPLNALALLVIVGLVWTLPNALVFSKQLK